jgi:hypothetical protein
LFALISISASWRPSAAGDHRQLATIGSWRPSAAGDHRQLATIGKINPIPNNTFATSEHLILSHFAQAEYFLDI